MWGAIIGDIVGSRYEWDRIKTKEFEFFHSACEYTDDSVCTAAVADILLHDLLPASNLQRWCRRHPGRGYGGMFLHWIESAEPAAYGSFGNGAAMRVSPAAFLYRDQTVEAALEAADTVTATRYDHGVRRHGKKEFSVNATAASAGSAWRWPASRSTRA